MLTGVTVLAASSAVLLALLQLLLHPASDDAGVAVLWSLNFMMFAPPGLWMIAVVLYHDRRIDPGRWRWPMLLAASITVSEAMMGVLFSMDPNVPGVSWETFAASLTSIWFFWSMAVTMVALLLWVRPVPLLRAPLWGLALSAVVAPWITAFPLLGGFAMMAAMGATFFFAFRPWVQARGVTATGSRVLLATLVAFLAMSLSALGFAAAGEAPLAALPFGLVMATVMAAELAYLTRLGLLPRESMFPRPHGTSLRWPAPTSSEDPRTTDARGMPQLPPGP
jgi:hypothetical protein